MRRSRKRWKKYRLVRVACATLDRLDKLVPGARYVAESFDKAVEGYRTHLMDEVERIAAFPCNVEDEHD